MPTTEPRNSVVGARTIDVGWLLQTDKASFIVITLDEVERIVI
jgi:hypothetical protein